MRKYFTFILLTILLISCDKKYYYVEDGKEVIIKASNDKDASMQAFTKFEISKKVNKDMREEFGKSMAGNQPLSYQLFNSNHEDITYSVHFDKQDSLRKNVVNTLASGGNSFKRNDTGSSMRLGGVSYDTSRLDDCPVKVISSKFVKREYSNYKDIQLKYKNVSDKKIAAIRFRWYGLDAFGEPADMGSSITEGWGSGSSDDGLNKSAIDYGTWEIMSRNAKKVVIAFAYEVAFDDGTTWKLED